jgi:hypothetical protein
MQVTELLRLSISNLNYLRSDILNYVRYVFLLTVNFNPQILEACVLNAILHFHFTYPWPQI